jgi:predicted HAD superfamily hydrolase
MALNSESSDGTALPPPEIHEFAPVARELIACGARPEFLSGDAAERIKKAIEEVIETVEPRVLSFDVFDTFLLRNDKPETARYHELCCIIRDRIAKDGAPSEIDLLIARLRGMAFSYRTRKAVDGCREGHIDQVIRVMRTWLNLPREIEPKILDTELDYEAQNLTLNPVLERLARDFKAGGGKVVLISDMYLGKKEVAAILKRIDDGLPRLFDRIYSSADHIVSKRSGKIFPLIEKDLAAASEEFLHVGDAWEGDVVRARDAGWNALHFPVARQEILRREQALLDWVKALKAQGHDFERQARL